MTERLIDAVCPHCGRVGTTVRVVLQEDGHTKLSRRWTNCGGEWIQTFDQRDYAWAEVEKQRAEIERQREALKNIAALDPDVPDALVADALRGIVAQMGEIARKALEGKP